MVFDPFGDFETRGYLRNVGNDKDLRRVKRFEHDMFEAKIHIALGHLAACPRVTYEDFLEVHRILFGGYYPWAGQDRAVTAPSKAVTKENVAFAHPLLAQRAVETGLRLGQDVSVMASKPGEVMGLFAFGHPFLDGNGRTMLLVHLELCHRAGFSIQWHRTNKADYLAALGLEIDTPGNGILDRYLLQFSGPCLARESWGTEILATKGLDGLDDDNQVLGDLSEPAVAEKYKELEKRRGYRYDDRDSSHMC
jgi:cell filamentation protein